MESSHSIGCSLALCGRPRSVNTSRHFDGWSGCQQLVQFCDASRFCTETRKSRQEVVAHVERARVHGPKIKRERCQLVVAQAHKVDLEVRERHREARELVVSKLQLAGTPIQLSDALRQRLQLIVIQLDGV